MDARVRLSGLVIFLILLLMREFLSFPNGYIHRFTCCPRSLDYPPANTSVIRLRRYVRFRRHRVAVSPTSNAHCSSVATSR